MKKKTIYTLMNEVYTLRSCVKLGYKTYRRGERYYYMFEDQAISSLDTLLDVDYITIEEYTELKKQMFHIFVMYKNH